MSVKRKKKQIITRTTDVVTILNQYKIEHDVVAHNRTKYAIKALTRFFRGDSIDDLGIPACRAYRQFRTLDGVADSTIARELTTLRAAVNHARKWKRIMPHEVPAFELPSNLPRKEIWLLKDELRQLLDAADKDMYRFIRIVYGTGSRRTAIEELQWNQVNFHRKTINLSKKGDIITNKRRPTVPMGDLFELLSEMYDESTNDWVFGSKRNMAYEFKKTCVKAGLLNVDERDGRPAGKITPHVLRHSRATHLLEDGVSIYAVAKLLGDTPMTVQKTYGHISMSSLEDELVKSTFLA